MKIIEERASDFNTVQTSPSVVAGWAIFITHIHPPYKNNFPTIFPPTPRLPIGEEGISPNSSHLPSVSVFVRGQLFPAVMREVIFCLLFIAIFRNGGVDGTEEEDIRKQIMKDYDKASLPNELTNVTMRFTILDIDIDEEESSMILDTWIALEWKDPRLAWDMKKYPHVDKLSFDPDLLWRPDLKLYNSAQSHHLQQQESVLMLVYPNGKILHVPRATFAVACSLNMTFWPHDVHNCSAKFGSWVHSGLIIDLRPMDDQPEVEFEINTRSASGNVLSRQSWEVLDSSVVRNSKTYPCCVEPYIDLTLSLIVRRDAPAFLWTIKIPVLVISVMTGLMFLFPIYLNQESIQFSSMLLVLQMLFLMYAGDVVRNCPAHSPILIDLVSGQMAVTVACAILAAFLLYIVRPPHATKLPPSLRRVASALSYCLCLHGYRKLSVESAYPNSFPKSVKGEELSITNEQPALKSWFSTATIADSKEADWLLLGAVLNRIFFIIYIIGLIVNAATYCQYF
ncbi:Neurotransmitter-gated ion-channel ligand-binding domain [Trinorchestia longiramus]|nr:Neurotransmitter-gated ion-channel ligand-binding domain [Trinorchestia longiramus]